VRAEPDQPDSAERQQTAERRNGDPPSLAPARRRQHDERQRQPGGDLDADAGRESPRGRAKARARPGRERERGGERRHDQRVVVRATDGEHEQHGVQTHERDRRSPRPAQLARGASHQRDGRQARADGHGLERPQAARQAQRRGRVAGHGEQRPIGRVLVWPADEPEHFVAGCLRGDVRIGVESVQRAESREAEIAEHVLGDQRRSQQQDRVRRDDRRDDRSHRQRAREGQGEQIARAHDEREGLKGARADTHAKTLQRAGQPRRPAAAASGHVLRRFARGAGGGEQDRHDDPRQAEQAERALYRGGASRRRAARGAGPAGAKWRADLCARQSRGGRHRVIVASSARAGVWWAM
jgi:hypothetical protein